MSEKKEMKEEAIPVQEVKTKTISVKRFIRSLIVVILSFICVFIGVLIDQLHTPLEDFHPTFTNEQKAQMSFPEKVAIQEVKIEKTIEKVKPEPQKTKTDSVESMGMDYPPLNMQSKVSETTTEDALPVIEEKNPAKEMPKVVSPVELTQNKKSDLKVRDILQLRDNLNEGKSCFLDLQKLLKINLSGQEKKLLNDIMPVCLTNGQAFLDLNKVFYANKKKALMTYYKENNPKWLAYTKVVASMIVEVRRINPKKQTPKNIMFMAENALEVRNFEKTIQMIQKLPKSIQLDFTPFVQLATEYIKAQEATEQLILSFERKGE